ncbi:MAG: GerMN domain-containing protein [Lachnospiraceae bacterium]|nr:GerMN domain-containing protein [Lachnospiraceae bacterium]
MFKVKTVTICIIMMMLLGISGCGKTADDFEVNQEGYDIYYIEKESYKLTKEKCVIEETDSNKLISKLIQAMMSPENEENASVINSRVKILDYSITENIIYLNFSSEYSSQNTIEELLCRASFVLTLTQIEGIDFIGVNVNGQPLLFKNNTVSLMKAGDFIDISGDSIIKNNSAEVTLYFANEAGDMLKGEKVSIEYNNNSTLEKSIVEALIAGPKEEGYYRTISEKVTVLDAFTRNGICYVYFDRTMRDNLFTVKNEVMIYSIVNSLSELTYISKVQIIIDGGGSKNINDTISIEEAFTRNLDLLEKAE